jgi:hypothetical protein
MRTLQIFGALASSLVLAGCAVVAAGVAPGIVGNMDFDAMHAHLKQMAQDGQLTPESARNACLHHLRSADVKAAAPPPYSDDVCTFGSLEDTKYELTRALQRGFITHAEWDRLCREAAGTAAEGCVYDPIGDKVKAWQIAVKTGRANPEGARLDCERLWLGLDAVPNLPSKTVCQQFTP